MKLNAKTIVLTVIIALISFSSAANALTLPKTSSLLPPETVFMVNVDDFSQLQNQFEKTSLYKFYKDPAMAKFVEDAKAKWRKKVSETDNGIVKAIIDAEIVPEKRLAFALILNQQAITSKEPIALFITQWGQNISKIKEAVEKTISKAVDDGMHQKTEDYRSVTIKTIIAKENQRLKLGFSSKLSYCFIDDCLMGSEDIEVLKFAIAHIKGASSPTLTAEADYTNSLKALGPYHDVDVFVNIKQLIKMVIAQSNQNAGSSQMKIPADQMIANLGFDNVTAAAAALGIARSSASSINGKMLLKINGEKKGVCKMLELKSSTLRAPRFIPASFYSTAFINIDIKKAFAELANILNRFGPEYASMMYVPIQTDENQPPLKLKENIIDHFGSEIIVAQNIKKQAENKPMPIESIFALAINNRMELERSLTLLHDKFLALGNPDAKRELLGYTLYKVNLAGFNFFGPRKTPMQQIAQTPAPTAPTLAFTVTNSHFIIGNESTVEQAIRTLTSSGPVSISSAQWFTAAKSSIPSVIGMASLKDNATAGEFFWKMMKDSMAKQGDQSNVDIGLTVGSQSPFPSLIFSQKELFDPALLPEFDQVKKYFGSSTSYGISKPDGFFFEFNTLNAKP